MPVTVDPQTDGLPHAPRSLEDGAEALRMLVSMATRAWQDGDTVLMAIVPQGLDLSEYKALQTELADVLEEYRRMVKRRV